MLPNAQYTVMYRDKNRSPVRERNNVYLERQNFLKLLASEPIWLEV